MLVFASVPLVIVREQAIGTDCDRPQLARFVGVLIPMLEPLCAVAVCGPCHARLTHPAPATA